MPKRPIRVPLVAVLALGMACSATFALASCKGGDMEETLVAGGAGKAGASGATSTGGASGVAGSTAGGASGVGGQAGSGAVSGAGGGAIAGAGGTGVGGAGAGGTTAGAGGTTSNAGAAGESGGAGASGGSGGQAGAGGSSEAGAGGGSGAAGSVAGVTLTIQEEIAAKKQSPLPAMPADPTNAYADDAAAAALGQRFYFDKSISGPITVASDLGAVGETGKVSCASCHLGAWGTDTRPPANVSIGTGTSTRNTPPVTNVGFYDWFYWDGRSDSLWQQALLAGENAGQQASDRLRITHVIYTKYKDEYEAVFGAAFGKLDPRFDPTHPQAFPASGKPKGAAADPDGVWESIPAADQAIIVRAFVNWGKAIAAYERLLVSRNAPWDRFVAGDKTAISDDAIRGYKSFVGKGYCINCHSGPLFSDSKPHNIGVAAAAGAKADQGRFDTIVKASANKFLGDGAWSDNPTVGAAKLAKFADFSLKGVGPAPDSDLGLFRTKHLRQISETGPYMHNGSLATLEDVMQLYADGGGKSGIGVLDKAFDGHVALTPEESAQVIVFMKTLTGDPPPAALLVDTSAPLASGPGGASPSPLPPGHSLPPGAQPGRGEWPFHFAGRAAVATKRVRAATTGRACRRGAEATAVCERSSDPIRPGATARLAPNLDRAPCSERGTAPGSRRASPVSRQCPPRPAFLRVVRARRALGAGRRRLRQTCSHRPAASALRLGLDGQAPRRPRFFCPGTHENDRQSPPRHRSRGRGHDRGRHRQAV